MTWHDTTWTEVCCDLPGYAMIWRNMIQVDIVWPECACVCMYVVCVCCVWCASMNVWRYECANVWRYDCKQVWVDAWCHEYVNVWPDVCLNVCMYDCMHELHVCIPMCVYIYIYIYNAIRRVLSRFVWTWHNSHELSAVPTYVQLCSWTSLALAGLSTTICAKRELSPWTTGAAPSWARRTPDGKGSVPGGEGDPAGRLAGWLAVRLAVLPVPGRSCSCLRGEVPQVEGRTPNVLTRNS